MTYHQCGAGGKAVGLIFLSLISFILASPTHAEVKVSVPTTEVNLRALSLKQVVKELGNVFEGGYLKKGDGLNSYHPQAKITVSTEQDTSGEKQPVIYLNERGMSIDKLYFSQIEKVMGAVKEEDGKTTNHLLVSYIPPSEQGFLERGRVFYDFLVREEAAASYLLSLAQCYNRNHSSGNCPSVEADSFPENRASVNLSVTDLEAICSENTSTLSEKYEIKILGEVRYEDCLYNLKAGEFRSFLIWIAASAKKGDTLVFCGNADKRSPRRCSTPSNFQLSFYRAKELAKQVYEVGVEEMEYTTQIPYPNGTTLDEKSTKVYGVSPKYSE